MVFNVFGPDHCVFHPAALEPESVSLLRGRFRHCLEIDSADQRRMLTNFLLVGETTAIATAPLARPVAAAARAAGRELLPIDLSEIQKAGGGVRCATCLFEPG